jgi:hypothetical protein
MASMTAQMTRRLVERGRTATAQITVPDRQALPIDDGRPLA